MTLSVAEEGNAAVEEVRVRIVVLNSGEARRAVRMAAPMLPLPYVED